MGPNGPCILYDSNCQNTPHDTQFMQHYVSAHMISHLYLWEEHFECLQAMDPNGPYMTCGPNWLNYSHGPLLKEHYDQLWPSHIDICKGEAFQVFPME